MPRCVLTNGRRLMRDGRRVLAPSQAAACAGGCGICGPPPPCTCQNDPGTTLDACCCIPAGEPGSCALDTARCVDPCQPPPLVCPCPGTTIDRPACCCLPLSDPNSCATNVGACITPCAGPCPSGPYTIVGEHRRITCGCSSNVITDVTAFGAASWDANQQLISQTGSLTYIIKRFYGPSNAHVTTCTISGFLSVGMGASCFNGTGEASFTVSVAGRATCPSCYQDGPIPAAGNCASEGYPAFSQAGVTAGCGNESSVSLSCEPCQGSGQYSNQPPIRGCNFSAHDQRSNGLCFPACVRSFEELNKCVVYATYQNCGGAAIIAPGPLIQTSRAIVVPGQPAGGCAGCGNAENVTTVRQGPLITSPTGGTGLRAPLATPTRSVILPSAEQTRAYGNFRTGARGARRSSRATCSA